MLETLCHIGAVRIKRIWFARMPFEASGCEFVEFQDCKLGLDVPGLKRHAAHTLTIDLTQSLESIWDKFDKKSCRYEIKRAERDGVAVGLSTAFDSFCGLNRRFRKAKGLPPAINDKYLKQYGTLFTAVLPSGILAGQVYLEDRDTIRWLLGASERLTMNHPLTGAANRALIWEAIKYAKANGIKEFDFGGYHMGEDAELKRINFFKESFGGKLVERHNYQGPCVPGVVMAGMEKLAIVKERLWGRDTRTTVSAKEAGLEEAVSFRSSPSGDKYLEAALWSLGITDSDRIIDVGCGKGSAMLTMLKFPFARVAGLELSSSVIQVAQRNMRSIDQMKSILIEGDARLFGDYDLYNMVYMYNPFPDAVMKDVICHIENSYFRKPRKMTLIYNNPTCHETIEADGVFRRVAEYPNKWGTGISIYTNGGFV